MFSDLVTYLPPDELRTQAYSKMMLSEREYRDLGSMTRPSQHNELFFQFIMPRGATSYRSFLSILANLGSSYSWRVEELQPALGEWILVR